NWPFENPNFEKLEDEKKNFKKNEVTDIRNTVGNIPMEWYKDYPHVGYNLQGQRILKPLRTKDELDAFLDKMENPDYWRTVYDKNTDTDIKLTDEQVALVRRLQQGRYGDPSIDPYEPASDFFSSQVMIHPVTNTPAHKRSFIPSLSDKEKVSKLVHAIKMGWIKPRLPRDDMPRYYDLWASEDPRAIMGRHGMHVPAPRVPLPSNAESYNPPPEYLLTEEEKLAWDAQEPQERKLNFLPAKFKNLRSVPAYARFVQERFERCLDLYLCPRQRKLRVNVDPEDLIPKLPKPRDLQPFPTVQSMFVRSISIDPSGQWLVSGSDDRTLRFWEVCSGRCVHVVSVEGVVRSVAWSPNAAVCLVACAVNETVVLINPFLGDWLLCQGTDGLLASYTPPEEAVPQPATWVAADVTDNELGIRLTIRHTKPVKQVTWHGKGDYFAVVVAETGGSQVVVHQVTRRRSQVPFRRNKGLVQAVAFHPLRPCLFVATQRFVRIYNLIKQELTKKLMASCKWLSGMAIHPAGDHVICGSYDRRMTWFDLDLSTRPYKVLKHHRKAVRAVCFHKRYPLFASASDDATAIVCHGMAYSDLLKNPLIVPVKVLKGHHVSHDLGILDVTFHPTQPWLFTAGADTTIRLYS
uniref:Ribosome biogenesis protein BOP1 n=1 Tax=Eptatretus burgeri TaxID=7764 RepID=A0A8C4NCP9_EPTBU